MDGENQPTSPTPERTRMAPRMSARQASMPNSTFPTTKHTTRRSARPSTAPELRPRKFSCIPSASLADSRRVLSTTTKSRTHASEDSISGDNRITDRKTTRDEISNSGDDDPRIGTNNYGEWNTSAKPPQIGQTESSYDWPSFMSAYTLGRWDPLRTPKRPMSAVTSDYSSSDLSCAGSSCPVSQSSFSSIDSSEGSSHDQTGRSVGSPDDLKGEIHTGAQPSGISLGPLTKLQPATFSNSTHRPHSSVTDLRSKWAGPQSESLGSEEQGPFSTPEVVTAAATLRWAAARVNLSPLALPSPERELTDPMHDHTAAIPGSHLSEVNGSDSYVNSMSQLSLSSFWEGTKDVNDQNRLPTIEGSPTLDTYEPLNRDYFPFPASAPTQSGADIPKEDYFGDFEPSPFKEVKKDGRRALLSVASPGLVPNIDVGTLSAPATSRSVVLARQTSSPLPASSQVDTMPTGSRNAVENTKSKVGRTAREEQLFVEYGYLPPPYPPNEAERQRALHKYNIWKTGPDLNFDRIAHLAQLVFNSKGVILSLINGNEQWFKSRCGMKMTGCLRMNSFCGHVVLQHRDEPMVVLDAQKDWRFAKNPLVIREPNIRFYAGAPLRTQDGYNIGSLAVVADTPRSEFTPRQRHTLKEFAVIAMRELELWRDKIQLRVRDRIQTSMEQFSRECLEVDTETEEMRPGTTANSLMDKVYARAARLVKRTLDVEDVVVVDVSQCEALEPMSGKDSLSVTMHSGDPQKGTVTLTFSPEEYDTLNLFFTKHPDGKISEGIIPHCLRPILPTHIQYALTVPIFNIDKRPFALLCAYNASDQPKRFLEGHELSYLRAIGVIILSVVLKRRMIFADKAKSLFISNISHELRTPLHGILAAAELLADTPLNHCQLSYLQTVQACGTSLVETVNHVLDFTKLNGSSTFGSINVILPSRVNMMHLVEDAIDSCWIGHRARTELQDSGIGSVYSPPVNEGQLNKEPSLTSNFVEAVIDIGYRKSGWVVECEKGGMRRILMNLFGNSLKFTTDGFIHVVLRELPPTEDMPPNKVKIELSVHDTGKGISQNFLKNQLFHPFSQENPLQTGTGLGLAIVNSIVHSKTVAGTVDVWSEEGVGTEIKVIFQAEASDDAENCSPDIAPMKFMNLEEPLTFSLVGFDDSHPGVQLLKRTLINYLVTWWEFRIQPSTSEYGMIIILNDDARPVMAATEKMDISRPFIILSSSRNNPHTISVANAHERIGGFCQMVYKPGGPSRLESVLKLCMRALRIGTTSSHFMPVHEASAKPHGTHEPDESQTVSKIVPRCTVEEYQSPSMVRPEMLQPSVASSIDPFGTQNVVPSDLSGPSSIITPTIAVGPGGTLLKSSVGIIDSVNRQFRVLVMEDNSILRSLLVKWLKSKGYDYQEAANGRDGVAAFEEEGPFDVVLVDLSMPVLDGVAATKQIRQIEVGRKETVTNYSPTKILALTGMSALEDKRQAFGAGVDGYLVKPVAFKMLDEMFHKLICS